MIVTSFQEEDHVRKRGISTSKERGEAKEDDERKPLLNSPMFGRADYRVNSAKTRDEYVHSRAA